MGAIVTLRTEVLVFNGALLIALAALYLGMTVALAPLVWRQRREANVLELALLSLFPAVGIIAAVLGGLVIDAERPLGGHVWLSFATLLVACLPPLGVLLRWGDRNRLVGGWLRAREAEELTTAIDERLEPREAGDEDRISQLSALIEESERRARMERGFYRIAALLSQTLSAEETLDALAHAACEALGADFAAVLLPERTGLRLRGSHLFPDPLRATFADGLPPGASVLALSAGEGEVLAASAISGDDRFGKDWRGLARRRFESLLAIPVETEREGERGLAVVFFREQRNFSDDDLELAKNLAQAARGALERSALFERERRSRALSEELALIGSRLAAELEPVRVIAEVAHEVPRLLDVEACAVQVLSDAELVVRSAHGRGAEDAIGRNMSVSAGLVGQVLQTRDAVAVPQLEPADEQGDPMLAGGYEAYLGVPFAAPRSALAGVLSVYSAGPRDWREEEVEALAALARSAAVALSNAELYREVAVEKERSETILASVADGIVAVDRDDTVLLWNAAAESITGVPREEAVGRKSADVLKRSLAAPDGPPPGDRVVAIQRGGGETWLSVTEAVLRDAAGDVAGRIFTFRDVSSERLVEQVKSDFVSTVSHQLRAPLTSIYGFAETLLRNDVLFSDEERRTFLQYVVTESERLAAIVDTLLNVARLEAGDLEVRLEPTDLQTVVNEAVERVRQAAPVDGNELVLDLPPEPVAAEADGEKLRQVLANLLDNAVKFSPAGGKVTVTARRNREEGTVEVEVADEGMGIPHAEQQLIFSKFYRRAELEGQEGMGAGLGLFIARGLVSAMGGSLRVSSVEGQGSSFVFELPLAAGERR